MKQILQSVFSDNVVQLFTRIAHWYKMLFGVKDLQLLPYYWAMVPDNQIMNNNLIKK